MIDLAEIVFNGLAWTCIAAWKACPVFLVVFVLTSLFRDKLPARINCLLWLLVIVRLLLPFSMESNFAMNSWINASMGGLFVNRTRASQPEFATFTFQNEEGKVAVARTLLPPVAATAEEIKRAESEIVVREVDVVEFHAQSNSGHLYNMAGPGESSLSASVTLVGCLLVGAWVIGVLFFACRGFLAYLGFVWRLRRCPVVEEQVVVDRVLRACDQIGIGWRPRIHEVASLTVPAVFGLFRPTICLPKDWQSSLSGERLDWVLRHELAHVKHRDGLLLFVAGVARTLHWFNPVAWIAISKLQHQMERAADELATRNLDQTRIREYGELLLQYAAGQSTNGRQSATGLLAMAVPKGLRRRIESLGSPTRKKRWLRGLLAVPVIALVAASGLTDAKPTESPVVESRQVPNFEVALAGEEWKHPNRLTQIPSEEDNRVVSINVEAALQKAKELQPGIDAEKFVLAYFAPHPFAVAQRAETKIVDGIMKVDVTKQQETLMKQMLEAFEQSGLWQIVTELTVIETNIDLLSQFDWSASEPTVRFARLDRAPVLDDPEQWAEATLSVNALDGTPTGNDLFPTQFHIEQFASIPLRGARISRLQSERLISQVQADSRSNIMQAPKVTLFNGQCAMISDMGQRPFVTDVLEVVGDDASAMQPIISVFEDGWKVLLKPTVIAAESVKLRMVITHASVDGVKLANLPGGPGSNPKERLTVQVPTVQSDSIAIESVLEESEALLVFSPKPYMSSSNSENAKQDSGMGQVFMIRSRLISDSDILKSFVPDDSEQ